MAVPTQRHTKSKRNKRRRHIFLKTPFLTKCQKCARPVLPHQVCPYCGYYKGVEAIDVLKKLTKKQKKEKEKEMAAKEKEGTKRAGLLSPEELSKR